MNAAIKSRVDKYVESLDAEIAKNVTERDRKVLAFLSAIAVDVEMDLLLYGRAPWPADKRSPADSRKGEYLVKE